MGVYDALIKDIFDAETGKLYPALSCCNNKEMAERCKVENAPKVIWAIKASSSFNTEICTLLRAGFSNGKINLLIDDNDAENVLNDIYKNNKLSPSDKAQLLLPYLQTTFLVYELINLNYEVNGTNIKIKEKSGMRKDRYSSIAYNYWVQCELEREILRKKEKSFNISDYANGLRKLNKKPNIY